VCCPVAHSSACSSLSFLAFPGARVVCMFVCGSLLLFQTLCMYSGRLAGVLLCDGRGRGVLCTNGSVFKTSRARQCNPRIYIYVCVCFATTRLVLGRAVAHGQKRGGAQRPSRASFSCAEPWARLWLRNGVVYVIVSCVFHCDCSARCARVIMYYWRPVNCCHRP
jgi:hypothetical protein